MQKSIGIYIDGKSGEAYELFEVTNEAIHPATSGVRVLPSSTIYKTGCGVTAQKCSDDLSLFELIERDGVIHKLNT